MTGSEITVAQIGRTPAGSCANLASMRRALTVLLLAATLAGCGGSSGKAASSGQAPSLTALAGKLGCASSLEKDAPADKTMFTDESGSCTFAGGTVYLSTFTGSTSRDNFLQTAKQSGGRYVVGDRWIVYGDSGAAADAVKAKIGGTIKT